MTDQATPNVSRFSRLPIAGKPKSTGEMPFGTTILLAGKAGSGKSTTCMDSRKPLYLDFENRLGYIEAPRVSPIAVPEGVDVSTLTYPLNTVLSGTKKGGHLDFLVAWLNEIIASAIEEKQITGQSPTLIFDTVDTFATQCAWAYYTDAGHKFPYPQDYKEVYAIILPLFQKIRKAGIDVIYQCHVEEMRDNGKPVVWLSMYPFLRDWFMHHAEMILYMYQPSPDELNRLYCHYKEGWPSKDGTGRLPRDLPATMSAVYACWTGEDPEKYQPSVRRWMTETIPPPAAPEKKKSSRRE